MTLSSEVDPDDTMRQRNVASGGGNTRTARAVEKGKQMMSDLHSQIEASPKAREAKERVTSVANRARSGDVRAITIGITAVCGILVVFGIFNHTAVAIAGTLYPIYMSYEALSTQGDDTDDRQWLMYWVVYGVFRGVDPVLSFVLGDPWLYYVMQYIFFIFLMHDHTKGARKIYIAFILPSIGKIEHKAKEQAQRGDAFDLTQAAQNAADVKPRTPNSSVTSTDDNGAVQVAKDAMRGLAESGDDPLGVEGGDDDPLEVAKAERDATDYMTARHPVSAQ